MDEQGSDCGRISRRARHWPGGDARLGARSPGFTLVELLIVVGIVAVLAAILLPVVSRAWAHSRFVGCKANLRAQVQAHLLYASAEGGVKPPLWQSRPGRPQLDYVSPDLKWNRAAVGQGLLVRRGYLTLDSLLDPSEAMDEDTARDRRGWEDPVVPRSGSSYAYFWRPPPPAGADPALLGHMTYRRCRDAGYRVIAMDLNADPGHPYRGEYEGRAWVNHPAVRRMNVGYEDGSVRDFPIREVILKYPGNAFEELRWVAQANTR